MRSGMARELMPTITEVGIVLSMRVYERGVCQISINASCIAMRLQMMTLWQHSKVHGMYII